MRASNWAFAVSLVTLHAAVSQADVGGESGWEASFTGFQTAEYECKEVEHPGEPVNEDEPPGMPPEHTLECELVRGEVTFPPNSYDVRFVVYDRSYPAPVNASPGTAREIAGSVCATYEADGTPNQPPAPPGCGDENARGCVIFELGPFLSAWDYITLASKDTDGKFHVSGGWIKPAYQNPNQEYIQEGQSPYVAAEMPGLPLNMYAEMHTIKLTDEQRAAFANEPGALAALDRWMARLRNHEMQHLCIFSRVFHDVLMTHLNAPPIPQGPFESVAAANEAAKADHEKVINDILKELAAEQAKFDAMYAKAKDSGIEVFPVENGNPTTQVICSGGVDIGDGAGDGMPGEGGSVVIDDDGNPYNLDQCGAMGAPDAETIVTTGTW